MAAVLYYERELIRDRSDQSGLEDLDLAMEAVCKFPLDLFDHIMDLMTDLVQTSLADYYITGHRTQPDRPGIFDIETVIVTGDASASSLDTLKHLLSHNLFPDLPVHGIKDSTDYHALAAAGAASRARHVATHRYQYPILHLPDDDEDGHHDL